MSLSPNASLIEVNEQAIRLLIAEMGIVHTARFIQQFTMGVGDSVAEKERLFGTLTIADIAAAIRSAKQQAST
jgi:Mg/Co/Ni transporter MgtE